MKFLLIISKNYWGALKSEETSIKFMNKLVEYLQIPKDNIHTLLGNNVNVNNVKKILYEFINNNYDDNRECKFYIYINGHGNQIYDNNNDEIQDILHEETVKDSLDEIYDLPDGRIIDDEITEILINAVQDKLNKNKQRYKPFICLISDHCSSGSMIDNVLQNIFNWISIGSSLDNEDSLMTGDGNVMTNNLLNVLEKLKTNNTINKITCLQFNEYLQKEMKESFIGDIQTATFHVSNKDMLIYKLFE